MSFFEVAFLTIALVTGEAFRATFLAGNAARFTGAAARLTGALEGDWGASERGETGVVAEVDSGKRGVVLMAEPHI